MPEAIHPLYPKVTDAIMRAENAEARRDPSARDAYLEVSLIEEEISTHLRAADSEGALARRGAVRAALYAGDRKRVEMLADRFSREPEASEALRLDFAEILETAAPVAVDDAASSGSKEQRARD